MPVEQLITTVLFADKDGKAIKAITFIGFAEEKRHAFGTCLLLFKLEAANLAGILGE